MYDIRMPGLFIGLAVLTAASGPPSRIEVAPFDAIQLRAGDEIEVVRGPAAAVVVTRANQRTLEQLSVENVDGVLRIGRKPEACRVPNVCSGSATIRVSTPDLSRVVMQGSGSVHGDGVSGRRLAIVMQGSGRVRFDGVRSELTTVEMDGSGVVELAGQTKRLAVAANGRGALDSTGLLAREAHVEMNGGGSVRARATGAATINANGGGSIRIEGTRDCRVARAGRADVVCVEGASRES